MKTDDLNLPNGSAENSSTPGLADMAPEPSGHGLIEIDADGKITHVDESVTEMANQMAESFIGKSYKRLIHGSVSEQSRSIDLKRAIGDTLSVKARVVSNQTHSGTSFSVFVWREPEIPASSSSIKRYIAESELIANVSADIHTGLPLKKVYENLAERLTGLISFDRFSIVRMLSDGRFKTEFISGVKVKGMGIGRTGVPAMRSHESSPKSLKKIANGALISSGIEDSTNLSPGWRKMKEAGLESYLEVTMGEKQSPIGYVSVRSRNKNAYSHEDAEFLLRIGRALGPAIQSAELSRNLKAMAAREKAIASIGRTVSSTLDFDTVWDEFVRQLRGIVKADRIVIAFYDASQDTIKDTHQWGVEVESWEAGIEKQAAGTVTGHVIRTRQAVIDDGQTIGGVDSPQHISAGLRSGMYAPLIHDGEIIGSLNVKSRKRFAYQEIDLDLLQTLADQIAGAIASSRMHARTLESAKSREAQIRLEAHNKALEQESAFKTNLISTVSHELRTPLTGVIAMADILHRNKPKNLTDKQLQQIEVIQRSGATLLMVTNDLLTASALDSGEVRLAIGKVNLESLFKNLAESMESVFRLKRQKLSISAGGLDEITADAVRVEQIIGNLLSNASKYSPPESKIRLSARIRDERVVISVKDEGPGISAKNQKRLFDTYFRANNSKTMSQSGIGLGLFIVKTLVEAHCGTVTVDSKPGKGSTFTVDLPVTGPTEDAIKAA